MENSHSAETTAEPAASPGFDYCFWSKLLVAIVLFPQVAFIAAWFFKSALAKVLAAACAIGILVYFAVKIDRMACFSGKIPVLIGRRK